MIKSRNENFLIYLILSAFIAIYLIFVNLFNNNILINSSADFSLFSIIYYFIFIVSFFAFIMIRIRRKNWKEYSGFLLFTLIFAYSLIWIRQGLDLTDDGLSLSKSWFMLHGLWKENIDFIWGTTIIGSLWFRLVSFPFIIWERIGYCLIISFMGLFSYKILRSYFDDVLTFIAVLTAAIFVKMNVQSFHYSIVPGLLILASIYFLHASMKNVNRKNICLIMSGIILGFSVYARFTYIVFLIMPLVYFSLVLAIDKDKKKFFNSVLFNYIGIIAGIIIGLTILFFTGSLALYLNNIDYMFFKVFISGTNQLGNPISSETHSFSNLLSKYLNNYFKIFLYLSYFLIFTLIIIALKLKSGKKNIQRTLSAILYLFLFVSIGLLFRRITDKQIFRAVVALLFYNIILISFSKVDYKKYFFLIFWAVICFFFTSLGSDVFIKVIFSTGGIILLLSASFIIMIRCDFMINDTRFELKGIALTIMISFIIFGIFYQSRFVYRDVNMFSKNNTGFDYKELVLIKTSMERKKAIGGLIDYLSGVNDFRNKRLLVVNSQPLLYTALNHPYYISTPWSPWFFLEDPDFIIYKMEQLKNSGNLPDYLIFPPYNSRIPTWPMNGSKSKESDQKAYKWFENLVNSDIYEKVYENAGYDVYKKR